MSVAAQCNTGTQHCIQTRASSPVTEFNVQVTALTIMHAFVAHQQVDYVSRDPGLKRFISESGPSGIAPADGSPSALVGSSPPQGDEAEEQNETDDSIHEDDDGSAHGWRT